MHEGAYHLDRATVALPASGLPAPVVSYLTRARCWRLERPYTYAEDGLRITVPAGFHFDLASVPRPFWWLIAPFELSVAAPLLHDFLYRYAGRPPAGSVEPPRSFSREEADRLFRRVMEREGVPGWRRAAAFWAVRAFGGRAFGRAGPC